MSDLVGETNMSLGFTARRGLRVLRDPLKRSRLRWFALAWILAVPTIVLGGAFLLAGDRIVIAKRAFVIYAQIPGDLHTHGAILLALGLLMVVGIAPAVRGGSESWPLMRRTLVVASWYYGWSVLTFVLAPLVRGGQFSLLAVVLWAIPAALPWVLLVGPPPTLTPRDETALIRVALDVGVKPRLAAQLAHAYFQRDTHDDAE